jgi:hypothetical protein
LQDWDISYNIRHFSREHGAGAIPTLPRATRVAWGVYAHFFTSRWYPHDRRSRLRRGYLVLKVRKASSTNIEQGFFTALSLLFGPNDPLSLSEAQTPGDLREFSVEHSRERRGESPVRSLGIASGAQ